MGGRDASRVEHPALCGTVGAGTGEAITVLVTPQRQDLFLICAGARADSARPELERLLASVGWTTP